MTDNEIIERIAAACERVANKLNSSWQTPFILLADELRKDIPAGEVATAADCPPMPPFDTQFASLDEQYKHRQNSWPALYARAEWLEKRVAELEALTRTQQIAIAGVANVLHPHWKEERNAYNPELLPKMAAQLAERAEKAEARVMIWWSK